MSEEVVGRGENMGPSAHSSNQSGTFRVDYLFFCERRPQFIISSLISAQWPPPSRPRMTNFLNCRQEGESETCPNVSRWPRRRARWRRDARGAGLLGLGWAGLGCAAGNRPASSCRQRNPIVGRCSRDKCLMERGSCDKCSKDADAARREMT